MRRPARSPAEAGGTSTKVTCAGRRAWAERSRRRALRLAAPLPHSRGSASLRPWLRCTTRKQRIWRRSTLTSPRSSAVTVTAPRTLYGATRCSERPFFRTRQGCRPNAMPANGPPQHRHQLALVLVQPQMHQLDRVKRGANLAQIERTIVWFRVLCACITQDPRMQHAWRVVSRE